MLEFTFKCPYCGLEHSNCTDNGANDFPLKTLERCYKAAGGCDRDFVAIYRVTTRTDTFAIAGEGGAA